MNQEQYIPSVKNFFGFTWSVKSFCNIVPQVPIFTSDKKLEKTVDPGTFSPAHIKIRSAMHIFSDVKKSLNSDFDFLKLDKTKKTMTYLRNQFGYTWAVNFGSQLMLQTPLLYGKTYHEVDMMTPQNIKIKAAMNLLSDMYIKQNVNNLRALHIEDVVSHDYAEDQKKQFIQNIINRYPKNEIKFILKIYFEGYDDTDDEEIKTALNDIIFVKQYSNGEYYFKCQNVKNDEALFSVQNGESRYKKISDARNAMRRKNLPKLTEILFYQKISIQFFDMSHKYLNTIVFIFITNDSFLYKHIKAEYDLNNNKFNITFSFPDKLSLNSCLEQLIKYLHTNNRQSHDTDIKKIISRNIKTNILALERINNTYTFPIFRGLKKTIKVTRRLRTKFPNYIEHKFLKQCVIVLILIKLIIPQIPKMITNNAERVRISKAKRDAVRQDQEIDDYDSDALSED